MTDLAKATAILDALADATRPITLSELAARTVLPRSTVHRVMQTLESQFYVLRAVDRSGYALGPGVLKFGVNEHLRLVTANRSRLNSLAREVREHVGLAVFSGREVVMIEEITAPASLSEVPSQLGRTAELHATATGRSLLMQLPEDQVRRLLPANLKRFTDRTVVDHTELLAQLDDMRCSRIATSLEEHGVGICAIATDIATPVGVSQSIVVVVPAQRLRTKAESVITALRLVNPAVDVDLALRQLKAKLARMSAGSARDG